MGSIHVPRLEEFVLTLQGLTLADVRVVILAMERRAQVCIASFVKARLHATINRLRFVFWHMKICLL